MPGPTERVTLSRWGKGCRQRVWGLGWVGERGSTIQREIPSPRCLLCPSAPHRPAAAPELRPPHLYYPPLPSPSAHKGLWRSTFLSLGHPQDSDSPALHRGLPLPISSGTCSSPEGQEPPASLTLLPHPSISASPSLPPGFHHPSLPLPTPARARDTNSSSGTQSAH